MNAPLPGRDRPTEAATQDEGEGFMAAMSQLTKGA